MLASNVDGGCGAGADERGSLAATAPPTSEAVPRQPTQQTWRRVGAGLEPPWPPSPRGPAALQRWLRLGASGRDEGGMLAASASRSYLGPCSNSTRWACVAVPCPLSLVPWPFRSVQGSKSQQHWRLNARLAPDFRPSLAALPLPLSSASASASTSASVPVVSGRACHVFVSSVCPMLYRSALHPAPAPFILRHPELTAHPRLFA